MRRSSLLMLLVGALMASACGARTGDDELLGFSRPGAGGTGGTGGSFSSGGVVGVGGFVVTGGTVATGGSVVTTGGLPGTGGRRVGGPCCQPTGEPGCAQPEIAECVCENDPFCCRSAWDDICVQSIEDFGCGTCSSLGTGGSSGTGGFTGVGGSGGTTGNCCSAHEGLGCTNEEISSCVCDDDPYCCNVSYDEICVTVAESQCMADCSGTGGAGGSTGGTGGSTGTSTCCEAHFGLGCDTPSVQSCVCDDDPYCCNVAWDSICVNEAEACGASCSSTGGTGGMTGTGGTGQCSQAFPTNCGTCVCETCFEELSTCLNDFGCISIFNCIQETGCSGLGCYEPDTCQETIDSSGGPMGDSAANAFSLASCSNDNDCPCN